MKNTLILVTTHRGLSDPTAQSIMNLGTDQIAIVKGEACIDRARSMAFDQAFAAFDHLPHVDTLLAVDDDMVFDPGNALALVNESRTLGRPVSARYVGKGGTLCAHPNPHAPGYWFTGLGFMAIPVASMRAVAGVLPRLGGIRVWCRTGAIPEYPDRWAGEDMHFCRHFHGNLMVRLPDGSADYHRGVALSSSVAVGHLKDMVLRPKPMGPPPGAAPVLPPPEKMHGAADQFPGEDAPHAGAVK